MIRRIKWFITSDRAFIALSLAGTWVAQYLMRRFLGDSPFDTVGLLYIAWGVRGIATRTIQHAFGSIVLIIIGVLCHTSVLESHSLLGFVAWLSLFGLLILPARARLMGDLYGHFYLLEGWLLPLWLSGALRLLNPDTWTKPPPGIIYEELADQTFKVKVSDGTFKGAQLFPYLGHGTKIDLSTSMVEVSHYHIPTLYMNVLIGSVELRVPPACKVDVAATVFFGIIDDQRDDVEEYKSYLRLIGTVLFGRLKIIVPPASNPETRSQLTDDQIMLITASWRKWWGIEFVALFFTPREIIIAEIGSQTFFEHHNSAFSLYMIIQRIPENAERRRQQLLENYSKFSKSNLKILYTEIECVETNEGEIWCIVICTAGKRYFFRLEGEGLNENAQSIIQSKLGNKLKPHCN